jgi:AcrR family transcriptional regulator
MTLVSNVQWHGLKYSHECITFSGGGKEGGFDREEHFRLHDAMTETGADGRSRTRRPRAKNEQVRQRAGADARTRQARGTLRRQQILDAAVDLFAEKGYRGSGLAALADRVGMTATGLLYYFGTKRRLLQEVVAERDRADAIDTSEGLTLKSLRDLGRHNVETATLVRLYVVLTAESFDPGDPLHDFFVDRYETARNLVRSILAAERDARRVRRDVDIDQIAHEVIGVLMGLEIQWLTDPERVDLAHRVESYIDRLTKELAPH